LLSSYGALRVKYVIADVDVVVDTLNAVLRPQGVLAKQIAYLGGRKAPSRLMRNHDGLIEKAQVGRMKAIPVRVSQEQLQAPLDFNIRDEIKDLLCRIGHDNHPSRIVASTGAP